MKSVVLVSEAPLCIQGRSEAYRRTLKITSSHVFSCKSCYKATKLSKGENHHSHDNACTKPEQSLIAFLSESSADLGQCIRWSSYTQGVRPLGLQNFVAEQVPQQAGPPQ